MTIFEALSRGIHELNRRKRLQFLFYAFTTIWALAIVAPAFAILFGSLGQSAWAERMAGNFDLEWVAELLFSPGSLALGPALAAAIGVFAVAGIAHLFLLGGAIQLFFTGDEFSMAAFFQGCGKHFWRFVRLVLVSLLFYVVVLLVNAALGGIGNKVWGEGSAATPTIYWGWFRAAVLLALLGLVNLIFDYARIRMVAADSRKAFRGAFSALKFVFANFRRTAGLYIVVWVILIAIFAVYQGLATVLVQNSLAIVFLLLLVRQAMVLARIWGQLLFYSSGAEMVRALTPAPPPVIAAEPEPPVEAQAASAGEPAAPAQPVSTTEEIAPLELQQPPLEG
jgi:hypothetical protein